MIVRILSKGKSFKGLAAYLTHDPDARTSERIGWTHTLNLAHDHVPSAVDEMLRTAQNAELLKQEAGLRGGGRATEDAVKHMSLNWSPEDDPDRDHMMQTTEAFLRHMGWQEHQAVLVAHEDKDYAHVHVMLNVCHPETGLQLNDDFEQRRAQKWALGYELEQGRVHCAQRLIDIGAREDGPTRPAWTAFRGQQEAFEREEKQRRDQSPILVGAPEMPADPQAAEWKILKDFQRDERLAFFADGKSAFSELRLSIYRDVREEYRDRWSDFYAVQRGGGDAGDLAEMKAQLLLDQKLALETRRDEACEKLREARDGAYSELLAGQRDARHGLHWRQEAGLDNAHYLATLEDRGMAPVQPATFRETAFETTGRKDGMSRPVAKDADFGASKHERTGVKSGSTIATNMVGGLGLGFLSLIGGLGDGLVASEPDPTPRHAEPEPNPFRESSDEEWQRIRRSQEEADREWRQKQGLGRGE